MRKLRSPHSLLTGIAFGVFLGLCVNLFNNKIRIYVDLTTEDNTPKVKFYSDLPKNLLKSDIKNEQLLHPNIIWLRCVVLLESGEQNGPEKNLVAIRDTWTKKCNETLFLTDSPKLFQRFDAFLPYSMRILLIHQGSSNVKLRPTDWTVMGNLIKFLSKMDQNGGEMSQKIVKNWTVVTDGRSYVHLQNLRILLSKVDENAAIIVGRKVQIQRPFWRSVLSNFSPLFSISNWPVQFSLSSGESPLIFSQLSLRLLAAHCSDTFRWSYALIDGTAGRKIGDCAARLGIALWDPVDQESRPLIVDGNLKLLFSQIAKNGKTIGDTTTEMHRRHSPTESPPKLANCCSDRAIAFALLNHKEQRMIDYGVNRLKVFGH